MKEYGLIMAVLTRLQPPKRLRSSEEAVHNRGRQEEMAAYYTVLAFQGWTEYLYRSNYLL
jgi:hypothetical protein